MPGKRPTALRAPAVPGAGLDRCRHVQDLLFTQGSTAACLGHAFSVIVVATAEASYVPNMAGPWPIGSGADSPVGPASLSQSFLTANAFPMPQCVAADEVAKRRSFSAIQTEKTLPPWHGRRALSVISAGGGRAFYTCRQLRCR